MATLARITTTSRIRRQTWLRIFGTAVLPVRDARPRPWASTAGDVWAYDLAVDELHPQDVARLAAHIARQTRGLSFDQALAEVRSEPVPILAQDCRVVRSPAPRQAGASPLRWLLDRVVPA